MVPDSVEYVGSVKVVSDGGNDGILLGQHDDVLVAPAACSVGVVAGAAPEEVAVAGGAVVELGIALGVILNLGGSLLDVAFADKALALIGTVEADLADASHLVHVQAETAAAGKKRVADARMEGEAMLAEAIKRAEAEIAEMGRAADAEAMASARSLADNGETKKAVMRARADKRMPEAVALIVERIVKG